MTPLRRLRVLRLVRRAARRVGRLDERDRASVRSMDLLRARRLEAIAAGFTPDDVDDETLDGLLLGRAEGTTTTQEHRS